MFRALHTNSHNAATFILADICKLHKDSINQMKDDEKIHQISYPATPSNKIDDCYKTIRHQSNFTNTLQSALKNTVDIKKYENLSHEKRQALRDLISKHLYAVSKNWETVSYGRKPDCGLISREYKHDQNAKGLVYNFDYYNSNAEEAHYYIPFINFTSVSLPANFQNEDILIREIHAALLGTEYQSLLRDTDSHLQNNIHVSRNRPGTSL